MNLQRLVIQVSLSVFLLAPLAQAQQVDLAATPAWFLKDIQRKASWLPKSIKQQGLEVAYQEQWNSFPPDVQSILQAMNIPAWMIALVPSNPADREEILKQFRFMQSLAGQAPASPLAARAEQLLIFGGSAQLPTPGDARSGKSLGPEGCTAAMSKYVFSQLKIEFPGDLATISPQLLTTQSSAEMKSLAKQAVRNGAHWIEVREISFANLRAEDIHPGSIMIAEKPGGTHVFGWTRVPQGWGWSAGDKMAIGNTGLPQFGNRMILAQEFVTDQPDNLYELSHNEHGPINSNNVIYYGGQPALSDPRTNVYAVRGARFILIDLK